MKIRVSDQNFYEKKLHQPRYFNFFHPMRLPHKPRVWTGKGVLKTVYFCTIFARYVSYMPLLPRSRR